jgi:4-hydroxybenzoate polyprenyltransferase
MIDYRFMWSEVSWKMFDAGSILFDDKSNDLRSVPKSVRMNLLITLSTMWSTVFTVWTFETVSSMSYGWGGLVIGHILFIFATYYTFHEFKAAKEKNKKFGTRVNSYDECYDYLQKVDKS